MKPLKLSMIVSLFFFCVSLSYAADGVNVSYVTGATSSSVSVNEAATFNASKAFDRDIATEYSNAAYGTEGPSISVEFDCSIINCYLDNMTIIGRATEGADPHLWVKNATTGVWFDWKTLAFGTSNSEIYLGQMGIGASGFNLSWAGQGNIDIGIPEWGIGNGTNVSAAPPADTCTAPGSGDWNVDCADNCNLNAAQSVPADMHLNGAGTIRVSAPLTFTGTDSYLSVGSGCTMSIESGGIINGG